MSNSWPALASGTTRNFGVRWLDTAFIAPRNPVVLAAATAHQVTPTCVFRAQRRFSPVNISESGVEPPHSI